MFVLRFLVFVITCLGATKTERERERHPIRVVVTKKEQGKKSPDFWGGPSLQHLREQRKKCLTNSVFPRV